MDITREQAIRNAVASAEMEGLHPTENDIARIRDFVEKKITHVIPIGKGDGKFYEPDEIVEGDTCLESCYYTIYQFHPQIEKVDGGYIVSSDWQTLITDDCTEVIMDVDHADFPFDVSLYYVPEITFHDRMHLLES